MGWAVVEHADHREDVRIISGGATVGTNQIAELSAVLMALREYRSGGKHPRQELIIETDSSYSIDSSTTWIKNWKRNGWKNSKKQIISNLELIQAIDVEISEREAFGGVVKFVKVKGHSGDLYNEAADEAANEQSAAWQELIGQHRDGLSCDEDYTGVPQEAVPAIRIRAGLPPLGSPLPEITLI
jgi:ribonuclease HI